MLLDLHPFGLLKNKLQPPLRLKPKELIPTLEPFSNPPSLVVESGPALLGLVEVYLVLMASLRALAALEAAFGAESPLEAELLPGVGLPQAERGELLGLILVPNLPAPVLTP